MMQMNYFLRNTLIKEVLYSAMQILFFKALKRGFDVPDTRLNQAVYLTGLRQAACGHATCVKHGVYDCVPWMC